MKKRAHALIPFICIFCAVVFLLGIAWAQQPDKSDKDFSYWTVAGYRHGPSFFPLSRYMEIKPLKEGELDFKHYHTYDEMIWWMTKWSKEYPDLVDLYVTAKSFSGREIYQITLTNKKTGKHTDKPAMFVDGNRHAGEVTAAESAFWMIHHMLTNYGSDTEITRLLDNFTFYFRPKNNPDGSLLYLQTAQTLRSTVRPYDNDGDGLLDEDPA
ncbi:MAG: peptidase, partial [Candidatus Aminicenantes bacterium]|nr:peptidase [Candidatus Aminicenantes bacterium]